MKQKVIFLFLLILSDGIIQAQTENSHLAETWELEPYGLNNVNTTFKMINSDKKYITLESDYAILRFKRF